MTTTIFMVTTLDGHEGYTPIAAYSREEDAVKVAALYNAYDETAPELNVDTNDISEQERIRAEFRRLDAAWRGAHPAGEIYASLGFEVRPLPLHSSI